MTRHETILKISHYEWMLEAMHLRPAHEAWIQDQLQDLRDSLAQFHKPAKECKIITDTIKSWSA
jgi:hypothetical protein